MNIQVGAVGAFFTAELFHRFIVFGSRQANTVHSSINVEYVLLVYSTSESLMTSFDVSGSSRSPVLRS